MKTSVHNGEIDARDTLAKTKFVKDQSVGLSPVTALHLRVQAATDVDVTNLCVRHVAVIVKQMPVRYQRVLKETDPLWPHTLPREPRPYVTDECAQWGPTKRDLVDLTGIEPVTSSMPLMRAPNCATGPLWRGR